MSDRTAIEWADATWNPMTGCTPVSEACEHCYAARIAHRFNQHHGGEFTPTFHANRLDVPLHWRKPRRIFVCSMSDLFHEAFTDAQRDEVFAVMAACPQHRFLLLTKRPLAMRDYLKGVYENPEQRTPGLRSSGTRRVADRPRWSDLACPKASERARDQFVSASASGVRQRPLLSSEGDVQRSEEVRSGTSSRLTALQWPDSIRSYDQSQERSGPRQPASQPGVGDGEGTKGSRHHCPKPTELGSDGREELDHAFDGRGRPRDSKQSCERRRPSERCEHISDQPGRGVPDRSPTVVEARGIARCLTSVGPLENLWMGVTCENQQRADERIPVLLDTPAAVRFVSVEPMLAAVDLRTYLHGHPIDDESYARGFRVEKVDWVIVGGETGPGARPMYPKWALDAWRQCDAAGVPFFFKKWGGSREIDVRPSLYGPDILDMTSTREYPEVANV